MRLPNLFKYAKSLVGVLFFSWFVFCSVPDQQKINLNSPVKVLETETSEIDNFTEKKFLRKMMEKHFPDSLERAAYEKEMWKLY